MAAYLRPLPALSVLLLSILLVAPVVARSGAGGARSAEYYQRRYQGRPRRGPVPTAPPAEDGRDNRDEGYLQWKDTRSTVAPLNVTIGGPGRSLKAGLMVRGEVGVLKREQFGVLRASSSAAAKREGVKGISRPDSAGLPVLTVLRFANDACGSEIGGGWGTCLLPSECSRHRGVASGACAHGFGVCCVQSETCGGETSVNNTYFVNPEHPVAGVAVRSCILTVHKAAPDVTQIRLDLTEFQMAGPTSGTCKRDVFSVSGQDSNSIVPALCGQNHGQHLYLEVGERTGPVQLRVVTSSPSGHRWRVRISQLRRTEAGRAPPLCLQYLTGRSGRIASFNYRPAVQGQAGQPTDGGYMNNLNYMICIRKESGFCSITYSTDNFGSQAMANEFNIVNFENEESATGGTPTVPAGQAGVGPIKCRHDFLVLSLDRLCGERLNDAAASSTLTDNADVTDYSAGQFVVKFVSNHQRTGAGFQLDFRQNPCSSQQAT
ncbi:uncharacterized protein LOC122379216 [Amphibalanus amphitrite]|uniref:uncharacterized protein LOC122379216 n=1 Tax=Amphibalanus amphitrite TaxID=1232801 RepID=UPI001C902BC3|nr:uncharacterized protein LOC122379216 [Amphibalanus amphitrite]